MTAQTMEVPSPTPLWAIKRWVMARYGVSRRELDGWRSEGMVRARVANRRRIMICVADVERVIARQVSGQAAPVAPKPCRDSEPTTRRKER